MIKRPLQFELRQSDRIAYYSRTNSCDHATGNYQGVGHWASNTFYRLNIGGFSFAMLADENGNYYELWMA